MKVIKKVEVNGNLEYEIELYRLSINIADLITRLGYEKTGFTELKKYYKCSPTGFLYKKDNLYYSVKSIYEKMNQGILVLNFTIVAVTKRKNDYIYKYNIKGLNDVEENYKIDV